MKEGKVYVPKDKELRAEVIWLHHNVLAVGHGGRWKTVEFGYKELLVARGDKRHGEICRRV